MAGVVDAKEKVWQWIEQNFVLSSVSLVDCPLLPGGCRVIDRTGDEMLVFYDIMTNKIKYIFPEEES